MSLCSRSRSLLHTWELSSISLRAVQNAMKIKTPATSWTSSREWAVSRAGAVEHLCNILGCVTEGKVGCQLHYEVVLKLSNPSWLSDRLQVKWEVILISPLRVQWEGEVRWSAVDTKCHNDWIIGWDRHLFKPNLFTIRFVWALQQQLQPSTRTISI